MSDPYVGEIRMFGGNFAPAGWARCDGQLLPIDQFDALYNLIGTTYGGDGQTTFALPNLQSRVPVHAGSGIVLGETGGAEEVTLTVSQIPGHSHGFRAAAQSGDQTGPADHFIARSTNADIYSGDPPTAGLAPQSIADAGGNQPHSNFQPYTCINFIIALYGVFPQQN